jgi:hypothetical protein
MEPGNGSSATVAELTIPVAEFALGETATTLDGVAFEIERVVPLALRITSLLIAERSCSDFHNTTT